MTMTADRWQDPCAYCGHPRAEHAAVSVLNDEHWCPKRFRRYGWRKNRMFVEPGDPPGSGYYRSR